MNPTKVFSGKAKSDLLNVTPNFLSHPELIFSGIALLFVWKEAAGLFALLAGIVLFDRNFCYSSLKIGGFSFYITEFALGLGLLIIMIRHRRTLANAWHRLPSITRLGFYLYASGTLIATVVGLQHYSASAVLRDSALGYYAVAIIFPLALVRSHDDVQRFAKALIVLAATKALICMLNTWLTNWDMPTIFQGQPGALASISAIGFLFLLGSSDWRVTPWNGFLGATLLTANLILLVRSSWLGLGPVALGLSLLYLWRLTLKEWFLRSLGVIFWIGGFTSLFLWIVSHPIAPHWLDRSVASLPMDSTKPSKRSTPAVHPPAVTRPAMATPTPAVQPPNKPKPVVAAHTPAVQAPDVSKPAMATPPVAPPVVIRPPAPQKPAMTKPMVVDQPSKARALSAAAASGVSRWQRVKDEIESLSMGTASPNVSTRFWMWRDALWELLLIKIYAPDISREHLPLYNLSQHVLDQKGPRYAVRISGEGFGTDWAYIGSEPGSPERRHVSWHRLRQVVLGVSFGKPYLPAEVIWLVNSPNRYEPHNSILNILYRMGLLGLSGFLILLFSALHRVWKQPKSSPVSIASTAALIYFALHALTDNMLENPFKGLWFWLLLGLVLALPLTNETPDRS